MKTIRVMGVGRATAKPDSIVLSLKMSSAAKEYEQTMDYAAERIKYLTNTLCETGFKKEDLKTTDFSIDTRYESVRDKNGNYKSVFCGYECRHSLTLQFDFDTKRLGEVLSAIAKSLVEPQLSVGFTIKDPNAIKSEILESAAKNAREKAEILCKASGVKLGELTQIDYSWQDVNFVSDTTYECAPRLAMCKQNIEITPDDIVASDNVTFVWDIY